MKTLWVAAGVLRGAGRVLITRRKPGGPHGGMWEFPGGKVEEGEDPRAALARELREELGIDARVGRALEVSFGAEGPVVLLFFAVELAPGSPEPRPLDVAELRWAHPEELAAEQMPPADRSMLELLRRGAV